MTGFLIGLLFRHLWQISLLIPVTVWLVRWGCPRRPHLAHAILMLCLLKCIILPLWATPFSPFCWFGRDVAAEVRQEPVTPPLAAREQVTSESGTPEIERADVASETPLSTEPRGHVLPEPSTQPRLGGAGTVIPLLIWMAGFIGILGFLGGKRIQLLRFHEDTEVAPSDELLEIVEEVGERLQLRRTPRVLVTVHPTIPFASGTFAPRVVLPDHLVINASSADLRLVVAHEMTHLRRGDLHWGTFQLVVQALLWFHPLVWWLNREIRRVREDCCDEEVLARLACPPKDYARCLVNVLDLHQRLRGMPELAGLTPIEVTAARLTNILRKPQEFAPAMSRLGWMIMLILALVILPGGPLPRPSQAAAEAASRPSLDTLSAENRTASNEPPSSTDPAGVPLPEQPGAAKFLGDLRYGLKQGEQFRYLVKIELEYPSYVQTWGGPVQVRVADAGAHTFHVGVDSSGLYASAHPKAVEEDFDASGDWRFPFAPQSGHMGPFSDSGHLSRPRFDRFGPFGHPTGLAETTETLCLNRFGQCLRGDGVFPLPLLLGDLTGILFPQLPEVPAVDLQISRTDAVDVLAESPPEQRRSPFPESPSSEQHVATLNTTWSFVSADADLVLVQMQSRVRTLQEFDSNPAMETEILSDLTWDTARGCWQRIVASGEARQRTLYSEVTVPVSIEIHRQ